MERRFWSKVDRQEPEDCWLWQAAINGQGYGVFKLDGKSQSAHRVAFMLENGAFAEANTCHTCDNKLCCNPTHLYDGTDQQNVRDAVGRGQHPRGERHGRAKLTDQLVQEMRREHQEGASLVLLGRKYGVSDVTAGRVCRRVIWKHLG